MPPALKVKMMGLPRWAWGLMLAGGVGVGLYLRSSTSTKKAEQDVEEGYLNSGNLMPPAAPIEAGGGGGAGAGGERAVGSSELLPAAKTPLEEATPPSEQEVELPESNPPPEEITATGIQAPAPTRPREPVRNEPIGPGGNREPIRGETIGGGKIGEGHPVGGGGKIGEGHPVSNPEQEKKERIQREQAERTAAEKLAKKQAEINRLQNEINGLQNHIAQLTAVIQEHPRAVQRGQWESERNADRANIDNKRAQVEFWNNW